MYFSTKICLIYQKIFFSLFLNYFDLCFRKMSRLLVESKKIAINKSVELPVAAINFVAAIAFQEYGDR